jgi:hypothetical protein
MVKQKVDNETPRERFKRLATIRTKKVIEKLRILEHCSNSHIYEYNQEDVKKIFSVIEKELKIVKAKFQKKSTVDLNFE